MDFLRRHVFYILCGVAGIGGIALGVVGIQGMPKVLDEMKKVEGVYASLSRLQSAPVNKARLDAEKRRIERAVADRDAVFQKARELYGYQPLVPAAFPEDDPIKRIEFRRKYSMAMEDLFTALKAGMPATRAGFSRFEDKIEQERAEERELMLEGRTPSSTAEFSGPSQTRAGVLTKAGAKVNPVARAHMAAAQSIYCYGVHYSNEKPPDQIASLDYDPAMKHLGTLDAPLPDEVWRAQLGYWIQKDVVDAIVGINNDAAEALKKKGETPWLGNLPIKEVISVRPGFEYVQDLGDEAIFGAPPGGYQAALPPGTPTTVFTGSANTDWYDVMQFSVKLVMDQRHVPLLVDRLCKNSFHTLLRVSYEAVEPNRKMVGKIHGSQPAVNVVMDFETIMLGEVFRPLMPIEVCEFYDINCPAAP